MVFDKSWKWFVGLWGNSCSLEEINEILTKLLEYRIQSQFWEYTTDRMPDQHSAPSAHIQYLLKTSNKFRSDIPPIPPRPVFMRCEETGELKLNPYRHTEITQNSAKALT